MVLAPSLTIVFYNRITTSGETTSRRLFHEIEDVASFVKVNL